jgi:acetyl-CoA synthetase
MTDKNLTLATTLVDEARAKAGEGASCMQLWEQLHRQLLTPEMEFGVHELCYQMVYGNCEIKPSWIPQHMISGTPISNIEKMMQQQGFATYQEFYEWSICPEQRAEFWKASAKNISVVWDEEPEDSLCTKKGCFDPTYFPGGKLNITDSCFQKRPSTDAALLYSMESDPRSLQHMSFGTLERLTNQVANAIHTTLNLAPGDAIGVCMPMTPESVAIYLGIVKAGCVVVSIADSFSAEEIAARCRLGKAKATFTQDVIYRGATFLPLYERVLQADIMVQQELELAQKHVRIEETNDGKESKEDSSLMVMEKVPSSSMRVVVLPGSLHAQPYNKHHNHVYNPTNEQGESYPLHESLTNLWRQHQDVGWYAFLQEASTEFTSVKRGSMDAVNILFSSGTTGEPKAIVWSHSTPIKSAIDGYYHQDIQTGDIVAWPTNIGWMMGPWVLFQLMNGASIGLFQGVTSTEAFCEFVDEARITMLGVIPSLAKVWQARNATRHCDWSSIRCFSSTGEASDPTNYLWLASRVPGYAPVMEYCGGTEIGGGFLSSTLKQPNVPSMFSSPVLGSQLYLLDHEGAIVDKSDFAVASGGTTSGELVLVPPTIGLSTVLLNRDHYDTYYKDMPSGPNGEVLRRHGDEIEMVRCSKHLDDGAEVSSPYFRALGRCDDTMNIGGIKVGSVEIERACNLVEELQETAAIAVSGPHGGPCKLVIYVVLADHSLEAKKALLRVAMQKQIKLHLNPLFGISDVVVAASLPRTASNKVMRRLLRDEYVKSQTTSAA